MKKLTILLGLTLLFFNGFAQDDPPQTGDKKAGFLTAVIDSDKPEMKNMLGVSNQDFSNLWVINCRLTDDTKIKSKGKDVSVDDFKAKFLPKWKKYAIECGCEYKGEDKGWEIAEMVIGKK